MSAQRIWKPGDLRLLVIGVAFVLAWAGIGFRLFDLQGNQARAAELATVGFDQRITERAIEPARGTIYDRDGVELAMTIDGWNIVVDPSMLDDPAATAALLAPYADDPYEDLALTLAEGQESGSRYAEIAMRVDTGRKDEVESVIAAYNSDVDKAQRITGVFYRPQPLRVYPAGSVASQVIGLTSYDGGGGIEGLEMTFNSELEGDAGRLIVELDPSGRVIPQGEVLLEPATAGADIVTTIDREIQFAAEQALRRAIQTTGASNGAIVVLDPDTGAVLAMASYPGMDLNERSEVTPGVLRNRTVADMYEPGSTLKLLTVAAALEEGIVTADTMIDTPRTIVIGEFDYSDHGGFPSAMTVADVLAKSSNIGTIHIEQMLGPELHYEYLTRFGLGGKVGLDVEGGGTDRFHQRRSGQLRPGPR